MPHLKKILIIDSVHPLIPERLIEAGYHCDYLSETTYESCSSVIEAYQGIIIRSGILIDKGILEKAKNLKFIGRIGSGMENIDIEYATKSGIHCLNSPEGNRNAVGEHSLGLLISLTKHLHTADKQVRYGEWLREENRGVEIKDRTVGIIGYGNTGSAFAEKLSGFGCRVIAYDKYKNGFGNSLVEEVDYQTIFNETDILSLHLPLTEETSFLVDTQYLKKFRKDIILINTSRGKIVNTSDLVKMIKQKKVTGAGLDVLEYEDYSFEFLANEDIPEPMKYLIASNQVILTPHIAGWTAESKINLAEVLVDKILSIE